MVPYGAIETTRVSPAQFRLWLWLISKPRGSGWYWSSRQCQAETGISTSTSAKAINSLRNSGMILLVDGFIHARGYNELVKYQQTGMAEGAAAKRGWVAVPNCMIADKSIGHNELRVWIYVKSRPRGWDFSAERIAKSLSISRATAKRLVRELESKGFLMRRKKRGRKMDYTAVAKMIPNVAKMIPNL
jgi:biotin operon repressor